MSEFINTVDIMGDKECLGGLVSKTISEFDDDILTYLGKNAFYYNQKIKKIVIPSVERLYEKSVYECVRLQDIDLHNLKSIDGIYALSNESGLTEISLPELERISSARFLANVPIKYVELPKYNAYSVSSYFGVEYGLSTLDITDVDAIIALNFSSSYNLSSLILRRTDAFTSLANVNAFNGTPIAKGYGYIYVPSNLLDTYKNATNWSTFADQIVSIDEYPKEFVGGTITDTWAQIFAAEANGTYKTKYSIGDTKALNVNGACVLMQIVAFDEDDLADDSGKAKITWLSVGTVAYLYPSIDDLSIISWETSYMREYLQEILYPLIDDAVKSNIKMVHKSSVLVTINSVRQTVITDDLVWIPSFYEITGDTSSTQSEKTGALYTDVFGNNTSDTRKIKNSGPCSSGSYVTWRLRTNVNKNTFLGVQTTGSATSGFVGKLPFPIGFCT